jgi:hypothetical protein
VGLLIEGRMDAAFPDTVTFRWSLTGCVDCPACSSVRSIERSLVDPVGGSFISCVFPTRISPCRNRFAYRRSVNGEDGLTELRTTLSQKIRITKGISHKVSSFLFHLAVCPSNFALANFVVVP